MSAPRFELVQTDAGWHARTIAGNGEPVLTSEVHPDRRDALNAIRITAGLFSVTPVFFDEHDGALYVHAAGMRVELRDVDERTPQSPAGVADLEPCDQCGAGRNEQCAPFCTETVDCRSIV